MAHTNQYDLRISRISKGLHDKIKRLAADNKRTMNRQLQHMIEDWLRMKKI